MWTERECTCKIIWSPFTYPHQAIAIRALTFLRVLQAIKLVCKNMSYEIPSIHVVALDTSHLIQLSIMLQPVIGFRIEIVGKNLETFFGSRNGKRTHASKYIDQDV